MRLLAADRARAAGLTPIAARQALRDADLLGHHVPAWTKVVVMTQVNHRLPTIWSDPERFDPDRFAEGRQEDQAHRFAFMPFGGGVHKCIGLYFGGMEIIAVLHRLLLEYEWSVPDDYAMPISWKSLPFPADGLPVTLTRRS